MKPNPKCGPNEILQLQNGQMKCACANGFVRFGDPKSPCEEYDPCNEKVKPKVCQGANTECKRKDKNSKEFECNCKEGFYNELGMSKTI